jgi:hypothetical protein
MLAISRTLKRTSAFELVFIVLSPPQEDYGLKDVDQTTDGFKALVG